MRLVLLLAGLIFISLTIGCSGRGGPVDIGVQPPSEWAKKYPNLAIQARELNEAFGRKDYARFADLIHPKVIEMAGGRERMIAEMTKELEKMEAEGVVILSSTCGEPTQFFRDGSEAIYAVLPTTSRVKAQTGIFQSESSMIAVSSDDGANWKFIDASGKDQGELKKLIPGIADKLKLPPDKPPVKISDNARPETNPDGAFRTKGPTSQRSWRQNLAQGGASEAKRNPGLGTPFGRPARSLSFRT